MLHRGAVLILSGLPGYLGGFLSLLGAVFLLVALWFPGAFAIGAGYPLLLLAAGLCLLFLAGNALHRDRLLVRGGLSVTGQITRRSRSLLRYALGLSSPDGAHRAWVLHYRYEVEGIVYTGRSRYLWKAVPPPEEDPLSVYYDPRHPQRSALDLPIF